MQHFRAVQPDSLQKHITAHHKIRTILLAAGMTVILGMLPLNAQFKTAIDTVQLEKLIAFADSTYADELMIIHKNKLVKHWKSNRCEVQYMNTASMCKSWAGLVIGIMIDRGLIGSENDLVCDYLPEWKAGCKNRITVKNLLNMTAGFNRRGPRGILSARNANYYALNAIPDTIPDVRFKYSNVSVQLLSLLIEKISGKNSDQYFREVLFQPLEMDSTRLRKDGAEKNDIVYGGAVTTIQDAAKIGLLMLNKGMYNGKRIVSGDWIKKSVTGSKSANYYGYLWWIDSFSEDKNYAAMGDFGQLTIVFPDLDLIFLRQQTCDKTEFKKMEYMGPQFLKRIASVIKKE